MKKYHVIKENYPITFKYTKPDEYFDGFLEKHSWYFSIADWFGNELFGTYNENEFIRKIEQLQDNSEDEDIQLFAYPMVDGEEDVKNELRMVGSTLVSCQISKKENYVFSY